MQSDNLSQPAPLYSVPTRNQKEKQSQPPHVDIHSVLQFEVMTAKYKLLAIPYAKVPPRLLPQWKGYKDEETEDTQGMQFFSENDLRAFKRLKMDHTGKNILTVLRHLGRLKEHRKNGLCRYIVM